MVKWLAMPEGYRERNGCLLLKKVKSSWTCFKLRFGNKKFLSQSCAENNEVNREKIFFSAFSAFSVSLRDIVLKYSSHHCHRSAFRMSFKALHGKLVSIGTVFNRLPFKFPIPMLGR